MRKGATRKNGHGLSPRPRNWTKLIPASAWPLARTRDEHSCLQPQSAPRTVQNGARGDECWPEREWPPFVTTTMELDETKGACQLYSWQVAQVRFISDHVAPHDHIRRLNGVRGGECWPNPNDMYTAVLRPQRQTLDRISRTCTGRVAGREARRSGMLRAAHPLSSARRRRAPQWATQQPYFGDPSAPAARLEICLPRAYTHVGPPPAFCSCPLTCAQLAIHGGSCHQNEALLSSIYYFLM